MKAIVHGGHTLKGMSLEASGYKHASSMVILTALAGEIPCRISNVPNITDTICLTEILERMGCHISYAERNLSICSFAYRQNTISEKDAVRAPIKINPINVDIMNYSIFHDRLAGPLVSGATKVALFIAMQCPEISTIRNPYLKGDVLSILEFLSISGYHITYNTDSIRISKHRQKDIIPQYTIISDPTEIITYMCLSIYCNFPVEMTNVNPVSIQRELDKDQEFLKTLGIQMDLGQNNTLTFHKGDEKGAVRLEIFSGAHQILSDHQPFYALLMSQTSYGGTIIDHVWKNRFSYANEINKMMHVFRFRGTVLSNLDGKGCFLYSMLLQM